MKPILFLAAASLAAISLGGCKKDASAVDPAATVSASEPVAMTPPVASPGQAFANAAAASDAFEIESSKLAASKAQSAKVKRFAEEMIKAHTGSTEKLKAAASAASPAITPDPQMTPEQQQTLTDLASRSGSDFDSTYGRAQTQAHQMTLDKLKSYAATGDVPSLKAFASSLVPTVTAHLNMAKGL